MRVVVAIAAMALLGLSGCANGSDTPTTIEVTTSGAATTTEATASTAATTTDVTATAAATTAKVTTGTAATTTGVTTRAAATATETPQERGLRLRQELIELGCDTSSCIQTYFGCMDGYITGDPCDFYRRHPLD